MNDCARKRTVYEIDSTPDSGSYITVTTDEDDLVVLGIDDRSEPLSREAVIETIKALADLANIPIKLPEER